MGKQELNNYMNRIGNKRSRQKKVVENGKEVKRKGSYNGARAAYGETTGGRKEVVKNRQKEEKRKHQKEKMEEFRDVLFNPKKNAEQKETNMLIRDSVRNEVITSRLQHEQPDRGAIMDWVDMYIPTELPKKKK